MDDDKAFKQLLSKMSETVKTQITFAPKTGIQTISSGSLTVDLALGNGGFPRGRIIEIAGKPSGGKTLLCLLAIAEAQKNGGKAAFIDAEMSFDPIWAAKLGVDLDRLAYVKPDYGEQAFTAIEEMVASEAFDIIVVDSVAALIPKAELEGTMEDQQMALQARMVGKGMRRITGPLGKAGKTILIFINQLRDTMSMYGEKTTTPGGNALKFYATERIEVRRLPAKNDIKDGDEVIGHRIEVYVTKNKAATAQKSAEFNLIYTQGIDKVDELTTLALEKGVIEAKGPMFYYKEKSWKGREAVLAAVKEDEALQKSLQADIQAKKKK